MSAPRSLHLIHTTDRRGAEVFGSELASELDRAGLPSTLRALRPGSTDHRLPIATMGASGRTPFALSRLRRLAREHDVVVGHGSSTLLAGTAATLGGHVPFVYQLIGDPCVWARIRLRTARTSHPLRRATAVVALWGDAGQAVTELHGLDPSRVHVIANGRDHRHFVPPTTAQRSQARRGLGLPSDGPVVGYIGALSREKQPLLAVEALRRLPEATLVIAGDGPLRAEVEAAAASSGTRAVVLGSVADTRRVLWCLDALLLTSRTEGTPGVVIEAGLCGVPSVAPDVGGTRDLVSAATGVLVPGGSGAGDIAAAVVEVLDDARGRGAAARHHCCAGYTLDVSVQQWAALLRALTADGPRR